MAVAVRDKIIAYRKGFFHRYTLVVDKFLYITVVVALYYNYLREAQQCEELRHFLSFLRAYARNLMLQVAVDDQVFCPCQALQFIETRGKRIDLAGQRHACLPQILGKPYVDIGYDE